MLGVLRARRACPERDPSHNLQEALKEAGMRSAEARGNHASSDAAAGTVDMHLEVQIIPVSDVDRSKPVSYTHLTLPTILLV